MIRHSATGQFLQHQFANNRMIGTYLPAPNSSRKQICVEITDADTGTKYAKTNYYRIVSFNTQSDAPLFLNESRDRFIPGQWMPGERVSLSKSLHKTDILEPIETAYPRQVFGMRAVAPSVNSAFIPDRALPVCDSAYLRSRRAPDLPNSRNDRRL